MQLVEKHTIRSSAPRWSVINSATWTPKNVYNAALYRTRQTFFCNQKYLAYTKIEKHFKQKDLRFTRKCNQQIDHRLHIASRRIIDRVYRFGPFIIDKNNNWKQDVHLGKRANQNFVQIPHTRFIEMLSYKAQLVGIQTLLIEKSHTSKYSFLDEEPIGKHATHYTGKRGLFYASDGRYIHAHVNTAYNILPKVIPDAFASKGIGDTVVHPLWVLPAIKQTHRYPYWGIGKGTINDIPMNP